MGADTLLKLDKPVIFFDGVCNLCNNSVQFIINNDKEGKFRFASLQSEEGQQILKKHNINSLTSESLILLKNDQILKKSDAALEIAKDLDGYWKYFRYFIYFPRKLRNYLYDLIAKNRYRWFGKQDYCMVPTPSLSERFLHA